MKARHKAAIGGATAAALALAGVMATRWEGERLVAYQDIVGVWTLCDGETKGVHQGDTATHAQCRDMLATRLEQFAAEIQPCLPQGLPDATMAAFIDVAYNIGSAGFCHSSMSRRALAGDLQGACDALLLWDKAGGHAVPGLTRRRMDERQSCLAGLAAP